jgi:hypothetical protein
MEVELESLWAPGSRHRAKPTLEDRLIARMLGRWLDRLIERADRPPSRSPLGPAAPCREQVREALPMIRSTAARLCSREPIDARGIACLKVLLSDLDGPCYVPGRPATLTDALQEISDSLDVGD